MRVGCPVSHNSQFSLFSCKSIQYLSSFPDRYFRRVILVRDIISTYVSILCNHLARYYLLSNKVFCRHFKFLVCTSEQEGEGGGVSHNYLMSDTYFHFHEGIFETSLDNVQYTLLTVNLLSLADEMCRMPMHPT